MSDKKRLPEETEQAVLEAAAFGKGYAGGDDNPDSPFQYQPSPNGIGQLLDNTRQNSPAQPDVSFTEAGTASRPLTKITEETLRKGDDLLQKYKSGKRTLEDKIVKNERWWKLRHWDMLSNQDNRDDPKPASGWLFNTIISKHADYMDSFPTADILPREIGDVEEAKRLSSIIPVVLQQNEYRKIYSEEVWYKLKHGT